MWVALRLWASSSAIRGIKETKASFREQGIKYSIDAGATIRRLPHDSFTGLKKLLMEIARKVGPFTLTELPPLLQITGIREQGIPGINWDHYRRPGTRGHEDILGLFIRAYFDYNSNTLDLASVRGFDDFLEQIKQRP